MMSVITKDQLADAAAEQGKKRGRVRKLYVKNSSPIPNWYLDEMIANSDIPSYVHAVFLFLLRRTIGWDKKSEKVDLSDIECGACVSRKSAVHAVRLLCDCWGIFTVERGKGRAKSTFTIGDWERDTVGERMTCVGWVYDTQAPSQRQLQLVPCTPATIERGRKLWNDYIAKPRNKQRAPLEAIAVS
jgi:hypothetical protein